MALQRWDSGLWVLWGTDLLKGNSFEVARSQVGLAVRSWAGSASVHGSRGRSLRAEPGPGWVELPDRQIAFKEGWKPGR